MKTIARNLTIRLIAIILMAFALSSTSYGFSGTGSGTRAEPYVVTTPEQLNEIRLNLAAHYQLGNDIDLADSAYSEGSGWNSIGIESTPDGYILSSAPFTGSLDGRGFAIKNMTTRYRIGYNYVGLFGILDGAEIRDLTLSSVDIEGSQHIGTLAADSKNSDISGISVTGAVVSSRSRHIGGIVATCSGTNIANASFAGTMAVGSEDFFAGAGYLGGIAGYSSTSRIKSSRVNAIISNHITHLSTNVGGLIGSGGAEISDSHFRGSISVSGKGTTRIGGISGGGGTLERCSVEGVISDYAEDSLYVGGLLGDEGGVIRDSYIAGKVYSLHGLAGGIAPRFLYGTVESTHVFAHVEDPSASGFYDAGSGLPLAELESVTRGEVAGSVFFCNDKYPGVSTSGATGLSRTEYQEQSSFIGLDFSSVWAMGTDYPILREAPQFIGHIWQPWSRLGTHDIWTTFANQLHSPHGPERLQSPALFLTASENGTPLTDKQEIADLAVAMQAKLVALEDDFWNRSFIDPSDVTTITASNKVPSDVVNGEYGLATPFPDNKVWRNESHPEYEESGWPWDGTINLGSFTNSNMTLVVPNHPEFTAKINELWNHAGTNWRHADIRRAVYRDTILFALFPEARPSNDVSAELRHRFREAFDQAWQDALADVDASATQLTLTHISLYFDSFSRSVAATHPGVSGYFAKTGNLVEALIPSLGDIVAPIGNSLEKQRVVIEALAFRKIQEATVRERLAFISDEVFDGIAENKGALFDSTVWINNVPGVPGWRRDPAMLFGFFDAKDEVEALLGALDSEQMMREFFESSNVWVDGSGEVSQAVLDLTFDELTGRTVQFFGIAGSRAFGFFKLAYDAVEGAISLANDKLIEVSGALQVMFSAATFDAFLTSRTNALGAESVNAVRYNQVRTNIRLNLGALFYSSYGFQSSANVFYGTGEYPWDDIGDALLDQLVADYQMTNPISAEEAALLAQAAYVATSVPGIINPPGQYSLTVEAETRGTATGGGFKPEGSNVVITAIADGGYRFSSWTGTGIAVPTSASTTVLMDSDKTVTATFLEEFSVSVDADPIQGGNVTGGGVGVAGETVPISAAVNSGYRFGGWSGAGIADPAAQSTTVTTNANKTVTASFVKQWTLTLVNSNPERGSVGGGGLLDEGTVSITASPGAGFRFGGWSGTGVADSSDPTTSVSLTQDRSVTANFLINSTDGYNAYSAIFGSETAIERIGPSKDFDGDGKTNFYEYVFGLDPTSPINEPDTLVSTLQRGGDTHGRLTFKARSDDHELLYMVWLSGDLRNWSPVAITYSSGAWSSANQSVLSVEAQTDDGDGTWSITVEDKTPVSAGSPRFIKVSAESPYNN